MYTILADNSIVCDFQKHGYRLPTEAEWEFAARAGSSTPYYWGYTSDGVGNYEYWDRNLHPVGSKRPNLFGLHDMLGNAPEWCNDNFSRTYYATSPKDNPTGPVDNTIYTMKTVRAYGMNVKTSLHEVLDNPDNFFESDNRCSSRSGEVPSSGESIIGLRCVLRLQWEQTLQDSLNSIVWARIPDKDKDGIYDDLDKCPNDFGTADMMGCSKYPAPDNMAYIPEGIIHMDYICGQRTGSLSSSQHVYAFFIDKYEVPQAEYQKATGKNPSNQKGCLSCPVENVSFYDAQDYCKKLGKRLPTQAEFERAARANTTTRYFWGNDFDGSYAWAYGNSNGKTHSVGKKKPNDFGLYDMLGNVSEWSSDKCYDRREGGFWMLQGGSFRHSESDLEVDVKLFVRSAYDTDARYGFRCARDIEPPKEKNDTSTVQPAKVIDRGKAYDFFIQGNIAFKLESYRTAALRYSQAIDFDPSNADYYQMRGFSYWILKECSNAVPDLEKYLFMTRGERQNADKVRRCINDCGYTPQN